MSELEPLIADLALILICAGAMTLLFKKLKHPAATRAYTLQGTPAMASTRGIVIENQQKIVRK